MLDDPYPRRESVPWEYSLVPLVIFAIILLVIIVALTLESYFPAMQLG